MFEAHVELCCLICGELSNCSGPPYRGVPSSTLRILSDDPSGPFCDMPMISALRVSKLETTGSRAAIFTFNISRRPGLLVVVSLMSCALFLAISMRASSTIPSMLVKWFLIRASKLARSLIISAALPVGARSKNCSHSSVSRNGLGGFRDVHK